MLSHANNHDGRVAASATRLTLPALGCMLLHSLSAVPSSCAESGPMHASRWTQAPKRLPRLQLAWDEAAAEWFTRSRKLARLWALIPHCAYAHESDSTLTLPRRERFSWNRLCPAPFAPLIGRLKLPALSQLVASVE